MNRFGQSCLLARRLIEAGVRFVTVNMFETVFDEITWDIHGSKPFSPISCYRDLVGSDVRQWPTARCWKICRSAACSTTPWWWRWANSAARPKVNPAGGRDHWPQCWTILMAGGGIKGGQVVGASDEIGAAPKDRPDHAGASRRHHLSRPGHATSNSNCPARRAGPSRWSIAASNRSRSCSREMHSLSLLLAASGFFARPTLCRFCPPRSTSTAPKRASSLLAEADRGRSPGRLDAQRQWRSSNPKVATVDANGEVRPVSRWRGDHHRRCAGTHAAATVRVKDRKRPSRGISATT